MAPTRFTARINRMPLWWVAASLTLSVACGDEKLRAIPYRGPPPGGIKGRICDRSTGEWIVGAIVTANDEDGTTVVSDENGFFEISDLMAGDYILTIDGETYTGERNGVVQPGVVTDIGVGDCALDTGTIQGRACDEPAEAWVAAADVVLSLPSGDVTTTTDEFGRFEFVDVPVGGRQITVTKDTFSEAYDVEVIAYSSAWAGDVSCGPAGSVSGRICGGEGYWISGARVYVQLDDGTNVETTTDGDGYFTIHGVPAGDQTIEVSRGSFYTSFDVVVIGNDTVTMPEPVCIPPTTRIAVITGVYDEIETVLTDLGFPIRATYSSPTPAVTNANGNIDIIDGLSSFWLDDFLTDPAWMADYDIIFFNCGLDDWELTSGSASTNAAIANLQAFVDAGGSAYASDWASEVIRLTFPNRINFYGDDSQAGEGRVGVSDSGLQGAVVDTGLEASLGTTQITLNLDLDAWVALEPLSGQPNDLQIMVIADVSVYDSSGWNTLPQANTPILVQFESGFGRVIYTSFHNESQTTQDLRDVLNYVIFEL